MAPCRILCKEYFEGVALDELPPTPGTAARAGENLNISNTGRRRQPATQTRNRPCASSAAIGLLRYPSRISRRTYLSIRKVFVAQMLGNAGCQAEALIGAPVGSRPSASAVVKTITCAHRD